MTDYSAIIRDHLTQQKAQSLDAFTGACLYKTHNGNKCAVGCLIPDELYNDRMEGRSITAWRTSVKSPSDEIFMAQFLAAIPTEDYEMLQAWQSYHDVSKTLGIGTFKYKEWLAGDESHSPQAFYNALESMKMKTLYEVIGVDGIGRTGSIDWPREPDFVTIRDFCEPLIQTEGAAQAYIEHVQVWHNGVYCSMIVDDMGTLKKLSVNEVATAIYNADWLEHDTRGHLEVQPIHGPVVLFNRNIWA